jgi:hypothetical protein
MPIECFLIELHTPGAPDQPNFWMRRSTGEVRTLKDWEPGAIWRADWLEGVSGGWLFDGKGGTDGRVYVCRLPGNHDWVIDSRASNCTMPTDDGHRCWVRHGTAPLLTVDKIGRTCAAGAGSIQTEKWHGFLRLGQLIQC